MKNFLNKVLNSIAFETIKQNVFRAENIAIQIDSFKSYFFNDPKKVINELENLKKNLDKESTEFIERIFDRYIYLIPWYKYSKGVYFNKKNVYTEEELKEQKIKLNIKNLKKKYILKANKNFEDKILYHKHVFLQDYGIKFLPSKVISNLKNRDFIDCGAYIGDTALIFSGYTNGKVYAFEPNNQNYEILKKNIKLNKLNNRIYAVNKGVGDKEETKKLHGTVFCASVQEEHHSVINNKEKYEEINIALIDKFVQENNINLGLIKMDIEGYELEAIKGAIESIKKCKPVLIISVYHHPKDFFGIKPLIESLNLNYKFMFKKLAAETPVNETVLIGYVDE